jgi:plastocyanin
VSAPARERAPGSTRSVGRLAVAALLVAASCGAPAPAVMLNVEARAISPAEFAFAPTTIAAPANTAISIRFTNPTTASHTFVMLSPIDRRSGRIVGPGETDRLDFTTPIAGTYQFVCTVHAEMRGVLEID